ncbi:MAG TPA: pyridoxal phosphate-dependent aminotransferase [Candidatus Wunengus californicus]|uniref:pyridoxal phosphate-dependent aminotransferase n=1 Tax=Candidatus Wunengus californicus TaxID=3367619 RepID=UPI00402654FF
MDLSILRYPLHDAVIKAIENNLCGINFYPETNRDDLLQAIVKYNGGYENMGPENILLTNGLDEAIDMITRWFLREGEKSLIPVPTFSQFEIATLRQRAKAVKINFLKDDKFEFDATAILDLIKKEDIKLVWVCNPNNPTANYIDNLEIIKVLQSNVVTVVDECYFEFCGKTIANKIKDYPNLVVLRSFSKSFGLAGLRIGYIIANEKIIKDLTNFRQPASVNVLAQIAATESLKNIDYYQKVWSSVREERDNMIQKLRGYGFKVSDSETNFILLNMKNEDFTKFLWRKKKIYALSGASDEFSNLPNNNIRINVGLPEENKKLIKAAEEFARIYKL